MRLGFVVSTIESKVYGGVAKKYEKKKKTSDRDTAERRVKYKARGRGRILGRYSMLCLETFQWLCVGWGKRTPYHKLKNLCHSLVKGRDKERKHE